MHLDGDLLADGRHQLRAGRPAHKLGPVQVPRDGPHEQLVHHGRGALHGGRMAGAGDFDAVVPPRDPWRWSTWKKKVKENEEFLNTYFKSKKEKSSGNQTNLITLSK